MPETVVRVDLRQATLSEHARLREIGERLFLALENPPPVRSLLRVHVGDERKAFEVTRVIEVTEGSDAIGGGGESEPARGCYGRYVELERLGEQDKVGSEHLEPGIVGGGGVPAPVVIMNSGELLLGEASEESEALAAADGEGEGEAEESGSSESESESESDAPDLDAAHAPEEDAPE